MAEGEKNQFDEAEPKVLEFRHRIFRATSLEELEVIRAEAEKLGKLNYITNDLDTQQKHLEYIAKRINKS